MCTKPSNFVGYKDSADGTFPKFYDIDGEVGLLEFRVLLFSVDQSVGTLLASSSFDPVQQQEGKIGDFGGPSSSSSLAANFVEFGDKMGEERLEEQMTIRWAENVPRPVVVGGASVGVFGEGTEDEQPNGGRRRETDKETVSENAELKEDKTVSENAEQEAGKTVSENAESKTALENAEQEEVKTVSENAKQEEVKTVSENAELKALPKEGTERRRRVHSALSRRIFTIFDATELHAAEPPSAGEEFLQQRTISSSIRQRKIVPKDRQSTPKDPIQILSSSDRQRMNRRSMVQNEQRMCIMAYLGTDDFYDASDEYLLWELRMLDAHRLITDRDLDEIRTVNCAKTGKTFRAQLTVREPTVFDEIPDVVSRKEGSEETGDDEGGFEVPERNDEYWLHYMIEIGRGIGFAHDNLRVQWQLELPENWQYLAQPADSNHHQSQQKNIQLNGRTQRCVVKSERRNDVAHFGHPIEFTLNYGPRQNVPNLSEALDIWPRLLIRVTAEDSWGRIHVDGYSTFALPISLNSAAQHLWLDFVRHKTPQSKLCTLRETHLGQAEQLARMNSLHYEGLATEFSGQLELTVQCVHQSRHYISREILRSLKYSKMMRRIGISGDLQFRIAKVLEEFERVRRQLIRVGLGRADARK